MGEFIAIAGHDQDHRKLGLAGDINVFLAAELHRCCVQISEGASSVAIECDRVASLDVAALQILVALKDTVVAQGGTIAISGLSEEVAESIHLAGLGKRLGLSGGSVTKGRTE
ncbi:MAG: STAS domain-containing protein [Thermoguttaceae bacterium]